MTHAADAMERDSGTDAGRGCYLLLWLRDCHKLLVSECLTQRQADDALAAVDLTSSDRLFLFGRIIECDSTDLAAIACSETLTRPTAPEITRLRSWQAERSGRSAA